jgi:hypothetical protein
MWIDNFRKCNSWFCLTRWIAWLRRFKEYLVTRYRSLPYYGNTGSLSVQELKEAKMDIFRCVQRDAFGFSTPPTSKCIRRSALACRQLNPFVSDGIIRVGRRLLWAPKPYDAKHPVILPRDHFVSRLIVKDCHVTNGHAGTAYVSAAIRENVWIIHSHALIKEVVNDCARCKRLHQRPENQIMAPLPPPQLQMYARPFAATGVDYCGPFLVKCGRKFEKRYGCIFVHLTIRAVYIEITHPRNRLVPVCFHQICG